MAHYRSIIMECLTHVDRVMSELPTYPESAEEEKETVHRIVERYNETHRYAINADNIWARWVGA